MNSHLTDHTARHKLAELRAELQRELLGLGVEVCDLRPMLGREPGTLLLVALIIPGERVRLTEVQIRIEATHEALAAFADRLRTR